MKKQILLFALVCITTASFATIRIVDKNGGGQYTTIQAAINAALNNDTVLVWPGTYMEQITLSKNILLMGSGYENTIITGSFTGATITMSNGFLQWFTISGLTSSGVHLSGGTIRNCVVNACSGHGIYTDSGGGNIFNCVVIDNANVGIRAWGGYIYVSNCICKGNVGSEIDGDDGGYGCNPHIDLSYTNVFGGANCCNDNLGVINIDPSFISSTDYHIGEGTPCWNTGHPSLKDPDGTRSDMGYFGGPNCPIYPVVYEITTTPNGNNINIQAKARANY